MRWWSRYGADSARLYSLFAAPPDRDLDWQEEGVSGINRFLGRCIASSPAMRSGWRAAEPNEADRQALRKLHQTIRKITSDFDSRWHFNTSIASLMELVNELYALEPKLSPSVMRERYARSLRCCWRRLRHTRRRNCGTIWGKQARCFAIRGLPSMPRWRKKMRRRFRYK